jgi:hypothetical protein
MPRYRNATADHARHLLPLPLERRVEQPFVLDARTGQIVAPWPRKRAQPGDEARMDAMLEQLPEVLPGPVCWCWSDGRPPVPVEAVDVAHWLRAWSRDRAVHRLAA